MHAAHWLWWIIGGCTLFHFLWLGVLVGVLALAVRKLLPGEALGRRYQLSVVSLVALIGLAPLLGWRIWTQIQQPASANALRDDADELPDGVIMIQGHTAQPQPNAASAPVARKKSSWAELSILTLTRLCPWLMLSWIAGAGLMMASLAIGVLNSIRLRRRARILEGEPAAVLCRRMAGMIGMEPVPVALSHDIESPILAGVLQPTILLPQSLSNHWTLQELELVLLHELSHVRRWDNLINLIQRIAESLLFFQPAVWLVSRWIRTDREECCDDLVVRRTGRPLEYAEILTQLARRQRPARLAVAMGEHHLVGRIRRILDHSTHRPVHPARGVLLAGVSLLSFAVLTAAIQVQLVVPDQNAIHAVARASASRSGPPPVSVGGICLQITDESGAPAKHARLRMKAHWQDPGLDPPECPEDIVADADGLIRFQERKLLQDVPDCDRIIPVYIMDASGRVGATIGLQWADWGKTLHVTLRPLCRFRVTLTSSALEAAGRPLSMTKARISLPGNGGVHNLMGLSGDRAGELHCGLPPGKYQVNCFGGTPNSIETGLFFTPFEVKPGLAELDLGVIDLSIAKKSKPWGNAEKPAMVRGDASPPLFWTSGPQTKPEAPAKE